MITQNKKEEYDGTVIVIGMIRRFQSSTKSFGAWEDIIIKEREAICSDATNDDGDNNNTENNNNTNLSWTHSQTIELSRGGHLRFFWKLLADPRRRELADSLGKCKLYRQYSAPGRFSPEPRVHVILSSRVLTGVDGSSTSDSVKEELNHSNNSTDEKIHHQQPPPFSSCHPGYIYHGIKMQALPLSQMPIIERLSFDLATAYNLPMNEWSIGVDLIVYRNGDDSIGWHADDTQNESLILCISVDESEAGHVKEEKGEEEEKKMDQQPSSTRQQRSKRNQIASRPVKIRPKSKGGCCLSDGDEEIFLYVNPGDAYEMDGVMQQGYEHCLPKRKNVNTRRSVLIFRQGDHVTVPLDSGYALVEKLTEDILAPPTKYPPVRFGHPSSEIKEGVGLYSRYCLFYHRAHRGSRNGINGNSLEGCDSIIVSRQSRLYREYDNLNWLTYTSTRKQGVNSLYTSMEGRLPIRVFRSSITLIEDAVLRRYRPPPLEGNKTSYRYDGLYVASLMWDCEGRIVRDLLPTRKGNYLATFLLQRLPTKKEKRVRSRKVEWQISEETNFWNSLDVDELRKVIKQQKNAKVACSHLFFRSFLHNLPPLPQNIEDVEMDESNRKRKKI